MPRPWRSLLFLGGLLTAAGFSARADGPGYAIQEAEVVYGERVYVFAVWYPKAEKIPGADVASFALVPARGKNQAAYAKDQRRVYSEGFPLPGADPATFAVDPKQAGLARDRRQVYLGRRVIPGADAASFTVRVNKEDAIRGDTDVVARDRRHFSLGGMATADIADGTTFEELGAGSARDSRQVYFLSRVVPGADPATFRTKDVGRVPGANRSAPLARDKSRAYQAGNPLPSR